MKNYKTLLFGLFVLLVSCNNDDDSASYDNIDVVTGISMLDDNGQPIGLWNIPNEKVTDIVAFPNPANNFILVNSQTPVVNIWVVPASCDNGTVPDDVVAQSQNLNFSVAEIEAIQIKEITLDNPSTNISIDLSELAYDSFYRLFFETEDGDIFWQNIFRSDSLGADLSGQMDGACN